jgi:MFS family permease
MTTTAKIVLLSSLYFSQGLPFGFFTQALPVWMRERGLSLTIIGASSVLALPWALKLLWAPLVDRHGGSRLGRRRGWILPLQGMSAVAVIILGLVGRGADTVAASTANAGGAGAGADVGMTLLWAMAVAMFVTNLFAATQDIATDGLAVDILSPTERGLGNGVQVAAYRVGMVVGGGALLAGFSVLGWTSTLSIMAALLLLMSVPTLFFDEHAVTKATAKAKATAKSSSSSSSTETPPPTMTHVSLLSSFTFFTRGGGHMAIWAGAIALYKLGDALGSPMARTLLVDRGFDTVDVAWLLGTLGSVAGMIGALLGGVVARRHRLYALLSCGLIHAALMAAYAAPALMSMTSADGTVNDQARLVVAVLVVMEHVTGGMATVSLFTAMMDAATSATGASDYTAQASVVVIATGVGSGLSGVSADAFGYAAHFIIAGVVCVIGTLVMWPLYRLGIAPVSGVVLDTPESRRGSAPDPAGPD